MGRFDIMTFLCCLAASLFPSGAFVAAQDAETWAGKRVMVVRRAPELKSGSEVVSRGRLGDVFRVDQINGPWLWIKARKGWINQSDVVLYDRAIEHFTAAINRNPSAAAYYQRGIAYVAMKQFDKAVGDFDAAIARDKNSITVYNERGNAYGRLGRHDQAIADFSEVIRRGVKHPAVYTNRGLAWYGKREYDRALAEYNEAIGIDAKFAPAWEAGGSARKAQGDYAKAVSNFTEAVQLDSGFHLAHNNLAWILATCPSETLRSGKQGVEHATRACQLTNFQDSGYLDTLAAALAEAGRFDEAIQRAEQALENATGMQTNAIAERLKLYGTGKPYREQQE